MTIASASHQDLTLAVLTANRLLRGLPTVRSLPSKRATHQRPSIALVRQIHERAGSDRPAGWSFLELRRQTSGGGSYWKVSSQDSGGYLFYLFEHYRSGRSLTYEGPSYVYVVLNDRVTYLGLVFGGKLITA